MNQEGEADFNFIRELKRMSSERIEGCKTKARTILRSLLYVTALLNLLSNMFVVIFVVHLDCKMMWVVGGFVVAYLLTLSFAAIFSFIKMTRIFRRMEVYKIRQVSLDDPLLKLRLRVRSYEEEPGNNFYLGGITTEPKLSLLITEYMRTMGSTDAIKFKAECYFSLVIVIAFSVLYAGCFGLLAYLRFCGGNNTNGPFFGQGGIPLIPHPS